jgi:hypothetical protein
MRYLIYHEPHEIHGYTAIRVSEADAIVKQRASCVRTRGVDLYDSDEEALLDFIAVNWAWYEDIINGTP